MTSISVKEKTWEELNKLKKAGNTMDDVITALLKLYKGKEENLKESTISEAEFNQLLDDLTTDDKMFNDYLEKSRKSFTKGLENA
ncbi:MAG: hypothetical protein ACXACX_05670 [Candidatus Hodarchaeales archaeon]